MAAKKTAAPRKKVTESASVDASIPVAEVAVPDSTEISVIGVVKYLPNNRGAVVSQAVIDAIIGADGDWVEVSKGGKKDQTVRNNISKALKQADHKVKTRLIDNRMFVALND